MKAPNLHLHFTSLTGGGLRRIVKVGGGCEATASYTEEDAPSGWRDTDRWECLRVENLVTGEVRTSPGWSLESAVWYAASLEAGLFKERTRMLEQLRKEGVIA